MRKQFLTFFILLMVAGVALWAGDITAIGMYQGDLFTFLTNTAARSNGVDASVRNQPLGSAVLAKYQTGSSTFKTTVDLYYCIDEVVYAFVASTEVTIATAPAAQVATTSCIYLASLDSSGNITWTKGTNVAAGGTPVAPAVPADTSPFAEIRVDVTGSGSDTWTLGSDTFVATATTVTVTNVRWPRTGSSALATSNLALTDL